MDVQLVPMVQVGVRIPLLHFERLVKLAQERGLVTSKGRPNVAAAAREVLAVGLKATSDREQENENDEHQP